MSSPSSSPASSTVGFNPNQTPDNSQSITVNYPAMGLTAIMNDPVNSYITALCSKSSTSNVSYTNAQGTTEYKANKLWIVSNASGTNNQLHNVQGTMPNGELIIQNFDTNGSKVLYMCFLLSLTSADFQNGQIDNLLNTASLEASMQTVTLNADINAKPDPTAKYIVYTSSKLGPGATVVIFTQPIYVTSVNLMALQNNVGLFDMAAATSAVIPTSVAGSWMECDYVPIGTDEVTTFNLPMGSGLMNDIASFGSFRTIVMFIVFFFICAFAYAIIPIAYSSLAARMLFLQKLGPSAPNNLKRDRIWYMDVVLTIIFGVLSIVLIGIGAFADPSVVANTSTLLLSGFCIGVIYIIGYIIIQSKKISGRFIEGVTYDYK